MYTPTTAVYTTKSEAMMHEMFASEMKVSIDYLTIRNYQRDDEELQKNRTSSGTSRKYVLKAFGKYDLWSKRSDSDNKLRIWVPEELRVDLMEWYHEMLHHPGARRLEESVRAKFTCPKLSTLCKNITSKCEICSEMKLTNVVKDGKMPLKEDKLIKP